MIRLVCFDLGGVLIRICRTWTEGCERAGLDVRGDMDTVLVAAGFHEINDAYQRGAISESDFAERISRSIDGLYVPDEIARVHRGWTQGEYPGVLDVIGRIHAMGLETAALSNTCHEHWQELVQMPVLRALGHRFASHLLELRKPDAGAYRAVEAATGHAGDAVLFFDDLPENIDAARALGWRAEQIDPLGCPATQIEEALARHEVSLRPS